MTDLAEKAWRTAFVLYEGRTTPHRSCGIALAETFGLSPGAYQALRRGGITGDGECGAYKAGELVLGELLGDPDPTGGVTAALRQAITRYQQLAREKLVLGAQDAPRRSAAAQRLLPLHQVEWDIRCNTLTGQFEAFQSPQRAAFCTNVAAEVARLVVLAAMDAGHTPVVKDAPGE
jgi:hypothetical protein